MSDKITISVIKADVGGYVGHLRCGDDLEFIMGEVNYVVEMMAEEVPHAGV